MADDQTTAAPAPGIDYSALMPEMVNALITRATQPLPNIQPDQTPVDNSGFWGGLRHGISLLGEFAGSPGPEVLKTLSPAEREQAGFQALSRFGTGLMAASHYVPGQTFGSNLAQGFQAAEHGYDTTARQAAGLLGAQQAYAIQNQQGDLAKLKEVIPLLQMKARLDAAGQLQNPLTAGRGTAPPPGTSIATGGSIGGPLLDALANIESGDRNIVSRVDKDSQGKTLAQGGNADEISQGHFQIQTATWRDFAKQAGVDTDQFPTAMSAPRDVQARVASVIPLSRFGPRTQTMLRQQFGPLDGGQTIGALGAARPSAPGQAGPGAPPDVPGQTTMAPVGTQPPNTPVTIPPPALPAPVQTAGPGVPTPPGGPVMPPGQIAAPVAPPAPPPPLGPLEAPSREAFRAAHPFQPPPDQVKTFNTEVDPRTQAGMDQQERNAQNLVQQLTQQYHTTGDAKLLTDIANATDKYNSVVSQNSTTRQTQIEKAHAAYNTALAAHQKSLDDSYDKAHELAQTAGQNLVEKRQADDMTAGRKVTDAMDTAAVKGTTMNSGLMQMYPLLDKLPTGGIGALLSARPGLLGPLKTAGIISQDTADAVQLIHGLTGYMATEMKPNGLGSMREYEFDAFRAALPEMLKSESGQKTALAMLMNLNDRAVQESQWMRAHYQRPVQDASAPGGTRGAYNLAPDNFTQMDKALGPVIPHYAGDKTDPTALNAYRAKQIPGRPFYNVGVVMDKNNPGQPVRDANGHIKIREYPDVAPMP